MDLQRVALFVTCADVRRGCERVLEDIAARTRRAVLRTTEALRSNAAFIRAQM